MTKKEIKLAIRKIGLALNMSHNTVTTDLPDVQPSKTSWRIDHSNEIKDLDLIESLFNIDICPLYAGCNKQISND